PHRRDRRSDGAAEGPELPVGVGDLPATAVRGREAVRRAVGPGPGVDPAADEGLLGFRELVLAGRHLIGGDADPHFAALRRARRQAGAALAALEEPGPAADVQAGLDALTAVA